MTITMSDLIRKSTEISTDERNIVIGGAYGYFMVDILHPDTSTTRLFSGTKKECWIFMDGYARALYYIENNRVVRT